MDLSLIITIALTAITLIVWLYSFLMGTFRDGTAKAFWKFVWAGLSALAAFGIAMMLRGTVAEAVSTLGNSGIIDSEELVALFADFSDLISAFAGAIVTPILFCMLYLPVRWIFMIPQKLLWKHLVSPKLDKLIKDEAGELKIKGFLRFLWKIGGGVFRVAATIVLTSALFIGLTCYTVTVADAARPFVETYAGKLDKETVLLKDGGYAFADHFSVRTAAFTYGGLFRVMTGIEVGELKTNVPELFETTSLAAHRVITVMAPADDHEMTTEELVQLADETFAELCETDFFPSFVAFAMNELADMDEVKESLLESENDSLRDMAERLLELMRNATTESVRADLLSISDLLREASDSGILEFLLSEEEGKEFPIKNLMDEARLTRLFLVIYDNSFGRALFTPVINMALNTGLEALGAEPISLEANIENMSRTEMEAEARRLAKIIANLGAVLESTQENEGGVNIGSINVGALGEAFDLIKDSEILGGQFDQVLDAIGKSDAMSEALGEQGGAIIGAIKDAPSVEDALVISQSFAVMAEELSKVTQGGDAEINKDAVASALQGLVNSSSEENNEFILGKVDELLPGGEEDGQVMGTVKEIASAILDAVSDIDNLSDEQAKAEADSLLGLYDIVSGNTEVANNKEAAEEIIDNLASSTVLMKTVENAVESGNDFGVKENLPKETVDKIADVIESAEISEEQKATLLAFFGK